MQHQRADGAESSDDRGAADARTVHPGFVRARVRAIRDHFANLFGKAPPSVGHTASPHGAAVQSVSHGPPPYVAAPPVQLASPSPLFDTQVARGVRRLLGALGTSPGSVAAALEGAGVRGSLGDRAGSPAALYLRAVVGADPEVRSVTVGGAEVAVDLRAWWRPDVTVALPQIVHDFTVAFDAGCYPALLRDEETELGQPG